MSAEAVLAAARTRGWRIVAAESCTGGGLMAALTDIPGSSDVVDRGFVTYSNAAKMQMLGVREDTLSSHGAVSEETAREMASGALARSEAEIAVSITGIAGPGGSDHKPEGMVCFGLATAQQVVAETCQFGAIGRAAVRRASVDHALTMLLARL
ncbi:CinA family protein [Algicella marina]|uniref:Nicotinamide-nucleotide amidohydrolase family protein n=1 Tax=Algicella marina TaxID=2683284 RepID=A0A6P1SWI5_9RHOB|nr:CinA family protein [Algicella marina]QHQ34808.1 nicotinamide-nucleotide amidohydrolase family protein [Algicella marina]